MLQALLYPATRRESSSDLAAFADLSREGLGGLWGRKACFTPLAGHSKRRHQASTWALPLITRVTHAISDPKTDSSPTRAPPCKRGYLYWACLPLLFLFICVLALRTPVRYFCPRKVGLWALGLRKKCLDFLLKCSWVTSLCISPWTSLFFLSLSLSPHR